MRYFRVQHPDGTLSDPLTTYIDAHAYALEVNGTIIRY